MLSIYQVSPDVRLGLWRMDETPEQLLGKYPFLQPEVESFRNDGRKLERLSVYALLFEMTGDESLRIGHEPSGRPYVEGYQMSISHTKGYAALILSKQSRVAVDVETVSDRVGRIARRFIRPDEDASDILTMLVNWSAKETVFKFFSDVRRLDYFDMRLHPCNISSVSEGGEVEVDNIPGNCSVKVHVRCHPDFVLTYTFQETSM
ncbi:MAG: hypothetical protein IJS97_05390 [Prevotella sp.]|nr:hypothetical protein [Prevotella sp.]